jgi:hypothetical protein
MVAQLLPERVSNLDEFCCWPLPNWIKASHVNQFVRRISALLLFGLSTIPARPANPDLSLAPIPTLSQTAWGELQANHTGAKEVTLKATITARRGTVTDVTVKETAQ